MSQMITNDSADVSLPCSGSALTSASLACKEPDSFCSTPRQLETSLYFSDTKTTTNITCPDKIIFKSLPPKLAPSETLSAVEAAILRSSVPIDISETEQITVLGQSGIWANKCEVINWNGPIPINQYSLNEDGDPEVIFKKVNRNLEYIQELAIRYLKPSTPPPPGDIIITQEPNLLTPPAPPVIIRQQPPRPCTPKPLVIRESPPKQPPLLGRKLITISGKQLPPPPRKVVIERLPPLPSKPQPLIVERWLPYRPSCKRRVIFQTAPPDPVVIKPRNVLVQWGAPEVSIRQEIKYLGVVRANPVEYTERYGNSLRSADQLPKIVTQIKNPCGIILAADQPTRMVPELEGEIEALKLIDLEAEGLGEYKSIVYNIENLECSEKDTPAVVSAPIISTPVAFSSPNEFASIISRPATSAQALSASASASAAATIATAVAAILGAKSSSSATTAASISSSTPVSASAPASESVPASASLSACSSEAESSNLNNALIETPNFSESSESNTTIIVHSSPLRPSIDTSKLATPVSQPLNVSLPVNTSYSTQNPETQSQVSLAIAKDSVATLILENNSFSSQVFPESINSANSHQAQIVGANPSNLLDLNTVFIGENTSLFSNLSAEQQAENTQNYVNSVSMPNSMQSNDFTLVSPPMVPGTPASSVLSSRMSLKSTSIALISASASATSVSTFPTTTLNASGYPLSSNFPSTSSAYLSTAYPSLSGLPYNAVYHSSATTPGADLPAIKVATPGAVFKTPAPVTDTASQATSTSTLPVVQLRSNVSSSSVRSSKRRSVADSVIERLFTLIDINGDGAVSIEEAERIFLKLNTRLGRNYGSGDVKNFFQSLDPAGTGKINMEQFKKAFPSKE